MQPDKTINKTNMIRQRLEKEKLIYELPMCDVIDIASEGIMCASYNSKLEQLEDENINDW